MTKNQENKLSMYLTVQQVTNFHSEVWEDSATFKNQFNALEAGIRKINETLSVQKRRITGVTKDKKDARNQAVEKGLLIAAEVFTRASVIGENKTADRVSFSFSDLNRGRDTDIIADLNVFYELALHYINAYPDFNLTQEELDEFAVLRENYASGVENPRQAITNRARATKELKDYFEEGDNILKNRLDRLVNRFKGNNPIFWQQFKYARKIVNLGHRTKKSAEEETQAVVA